MKGDKTLEVLELLEGGFEFFGAFVEAFLSAGYGASSSRLDYEHNKALDRRSEEKQKLEERRRLHSLIYKLKKEGLITSAKKKESIPFLTKKGIASLKILRKKKSNSLPVPDYKTNKSNDITIVTFDVPEKEKRKRYWLRVALKNMDFYMIQKSVWFGKVGLPESFIEDVRRINVLGYLEIFKVTKSGTLRKIT
ncbi:MAG: hypothetical protein WC705_02855 [Candidatus Paceibacterota bacterium]|jgi:hypothetical protein